MKSRNVCVMVLSSLLLALGGAVPRAADDYQPGPDSKPQPEVPKGELVKGSFNESRVFRARFTIIPCTFRNSLTAPNPRP